MTDLRLQELLFSSSFVIACAAEDDPGGEAGSGESTTDAGTSAEPSTGSASTMPSTASSTSMSTSGSASTTNGTTTNGTTTDDATTSGTSPTTSDTDASASSTTMGLGLCEEFGMRAEECGVGTAADLEMYCDFTLNDAMVQGQECYDASVDVFVCALAVDCRRLMGGPAGSCPEEYETAQTICGG